MPPFRFFYPIEVRYGDLDPQGHLNNARYLTYMEHARVQYVKQLGLWNGESFADIGVIIAEARVTFLAPVLFGQVVNVGVRTTRLGNKSFDMDYTFVESLTSAEVATGATVQVAYDYHHKVTIAIPEEWRTIIGKYEGGEE